MHLLWTLKFGFRPSLIKVITVAAKGNFLDSLSVNEGGLKAQMPMHACMSIALV